MAPYKWLSEMTYDSTTIYFIAMKTKLGDFEYFTRKIQY